MVASSYFAAPSCARSCATCAAEGREGMVMLLLKLVLRNCAAEDERVW